MEENTCIFCKIASGTVQSNVVYDDGKVMGVLDINPATNGHVIVLPKMHYNSLYEMPQNEYLAFLSIARAIAYALILSMGATNVDMVYTQELRKGAFTPHALIHAIPRYNEDTVNYVWQQNPLPPDQAAGIAATITEAIEKVKSGEGSNVSYGAPQETQAPPKQSAPPAPKEEPPKPKPEEKPKELKKKVVVF